MLEVSILIPTYKRPARVLEAINSCLAQTHAPHEIIVGDDSPDQLTAQVVNELKFSTAVNIRYIHNKPSLGQAGNVNMLLEQARGDKIMLLHDDDLLMPDALKILADCFAQNPGISTAYGKQYIITDDGTVSIRRSEKFNGSFYRTKAYEGMRLTPLEAGLLQQFPNNAYLMDADLAKSVRYNNVGDVCDFDFGLRVSQTGRKIYFTDEYTAKYRISDVAISNNKLNDSGLTAYLMVDRTPVPATSLELKDAWMRDRAGVAVGQAIANKKYSIANEIFFSKHHFKKIFTPGGLKRMLFLFWGRLANSNGANN